MLKLKQGLGFRVSPQEMSQPTRLALKALRKGRRATSAGFRGFRVFEVTSRET